jgi:hypothetical protein
MPLLQAFGDNVSALLGSLGSLISTVWMYLQQKIFGLIFYSWGESSDLMTSILNSPDAEADKLTEVWLGHKQQQLQFVAVTVSNISKLHHELG